MWPWSRRWWLSFVSVASLATFPSLLPSCAEKKAAPKPPPPLVLVAPVVREDLAIYSDAVGSLDGYVNAEIRARVRGYLRAQEFPDGAPVKAGELLFTIEPDEFTAAIHAAKGTLERATALHRNTQVQLERTRSLVEAGSLPDSNLDDAVAADKEAAGQIATARGALTQAELNLSYTQIRSPIDGLAGIALVRRGNLVGQNEPTLLTTVSQLDPIRANFTMSEVDYIRAPDRLKRLEARDLAWAREQFPKLEKGELVEGDDPGVDLVLADGSTYSKKGVVVAVNRQVDPQTGTIQLQALFPNPDGTLRPGQFGRVRVRRHQGGPPPLVVPERALIAVQGAYSVGVVDRESKVHMQRVDLGASAQGKRIVEKGLNEGDRVVVEGTQKISEGGAVTTQPAPVELTGAKL